MRSAAEPTKPGGPAALRTSLELMAGAIALLSIAVVLLTCALRITYPYELEWMEGGVLEHVLRLGGGEPIYVPPDAHFVPFIYPPLYYCLSAALMPVTGEGFLGPRLVSLAGSIGCMVVIFLLVHRETGRKLPALCAAALYAASFPVVDGWFDVARVDSLFPFLVLCGALLIRLGHRAGWTAVAGLLLTGAFFTKQSTLVFAAPLLLFCLIYQPRRFPVLLATSVVPCVLISAYLHWRSDGWFGYYVFALPRQHAWVPRSDYLRFWLGDLLPHVPIALALATVLAVVRLGRWRRRPAVGFYAALTLGGFAASWLSRLHTGGDVNVIMPALAVIAILFGLAMAELPDVIRRVPAHSVGHLLCPTDGKAATAKRFLEAGVLLAVIAQLLLLGFNPLNWIPSDADRRTGDALVHLIGNFPGDVIVPTAPYLAARAGKPTTAHHMALTDVLRARGSDEIKRGLLADMQRQLRNPACDAILLYRPEGWIEEFEQSRVTADFVCDREVIGSPELFRPKSGATMFVPTHLFRRKGTAPCQTPNGTPN